ncbi:hypothetical protein [Streptomyces sp. NPDC002516]
MGAATTVAATAIAVVATVPAAQAAPAQDYAIAFQDSTGKLQAIGPDGLFHPSGVSLAPGNSPSIAPRPGPEFGFVASFQWANGNLGIFDGVASSVSPPHMAAGTSSSTAFKPTGGGADTTVYQSTAGTLQMLEGNGLPNSMGFQVAASSSPAVAWNTSGSIKKVAVVGADGFLKQSTNGSAFSSEGVNVAVAPGTSPAVAAGPSDAMIAVNSAGGDLLLNRSSDKSANDTGLALRAGSSPSITSVTTGGFLTTYVSPDGMLNVVGPTGTNFPLGQKVVANSNPVITADNNGGWRIAFNSTDNNRLATYDSVTSRFTHWSQELAPGTSPSIAFVKQTVSPTTPPPTTPPPSTTATLELSKQNPGVGSFIPYMGKYPAFGNVPPFHLLGVKFPQFGSVDQQVFLVKPGHSTEECGDSNAVIQLAEGQSLTPAQITTLYGSAQPHFTTLNPLGAVACWNGNGGFPNFVDLNITIQND